MKRNLSATKRSFKLHEPFVISRGSKTTSEVVIVHIQEGTQVGRGEANGVRYHGENPDMMLVQIGGVAERINAGASRRELLDLLPAGGARNAIDAALWDLEAKLAGIPAWRLAGVARPTSLVTNLTISIRSIADYEQRARALANYSWLKVKVGNDAPLEAVRAVRRGAPDAHLVVDANQAWSVDTLMRLAPVLAELRVDLLEQPISGADDEALLGLKFPIPICADEPVNTIADLPRLIGRYDFINIKLDKAGGLTAALELAYAARAAGLRLMVGCMVASSLAMAPAMLVGTLCEVVDLDGPLLQSEDWPDAIEYRDGRMSEPSPRLWG